MNFYSYLSFYYYYCNGFKVRNYFKFKENKNQGARISDYGLNRWVLRDRLNPEIESLFLMLCGILFHMAGAQTEKALAAMTVLVRGISSRPWLLERNELLEIRYTRLTEARRLSPPLRSCQTMPHWGTSSEFQRGERLYYDVKSGASFQLFLGAKFIFLFFNATGLLKNWKKQHFICSNLTLFIVPFFLSFFFSFFLSSFFSLEATAPSPLKWRPCVNACKMTSVTTFTQSAYPITVIRCSGDTDPT